MAVKQSSVAARHAVPTIYEWREYAVVGDLMSYETSIVDAYRQAAAPADVDGQTNAVRKGEKPADLPVQVGPVAQLGVAARAMIEDTTPNRSATWPPSTMQAAEATIRFDRPLNLSIIVIVLVASSPSVKARSPDHIPVALTAVVLRRLNLALAGQHFRQGTPLAGAGARAMQGDHPSRAHLRRVQHLDVRGSVPSGLPCCPPPRSEFPSE